MCYYALKTHLTGQIYGCVYSLDINVSTVPYFTTWHGPQLALEGLDLWKKKDFNLQDCQTDTRLHYSHTLDGPVEKTLASTIHAHSLTYMT